MTRCVYQHIQPLTAASWCPHLPQTKHHHPFAQEVSSVLCCNNDRPVVLTSMNMKRFDNGKHQNHHPPDLDQHWFTCRAIRSVEDVVSGALHSTQPECTWNSKTFVRMLLVDFSSAFNTTVPPKKLVISAGLVWKPHAAHGLRTSSPTNPRIWGLETAHYLPSSWAWVYPQPWTRFTLNAANVRYHLTDSVAQSSIRSTILILQLLHSLCTSIHIAQYTSHFIQLDLLYSIVYCIVLCSYIIWLCWFMFILALYCCKLL